MSIDVMRNRDRRTAMTARALVAGIALFGTLAATVPVRAQETAVVSAHALSGITVSGVGEVKVTPDIARLELGVQTQDIDPQKASADNARIIDAVLKAVRGFGIDEKDVRTSGYNLNPQYDYSQRPGENRPPRITGYQVSNSVHVTIRKIADTGRLIDAAVKAGATLANGISFDVNDDDKRKAQDEALSRAVADAERKAKVIARASKAGRIDLLSVVESGGEPPIVRPMFRAAPMAMAAPTTPVAPGEQTISASVTVRYGINPALSANY